MYNISVASDSVIHTVNILIPLNDTTGSVFTTSRIYDIETNVKSQRVYPLKKIVRR